MTTLSSILDPTLSIISNKLAITAALQQRYANTNTQFNVMNYGAVGDGTTDDTDAYQAACAAAQAAGGCASVVFPENKSPRIREGYLFSTSTHAGGLHSVVLKGAGQSESRIIWDPLDDDDYLARWYTDGDYYAGGGAERLLIKPVSATSTGPVFHLTDTYMTRFSDVAVFGVTTGTGILVDSFGIATQHLVLNNVMLQGLDVGIDIDNVTAMSAYELKLNQCTSAHGIIRSGSLSWFGGLIQGANASLEFRPTITNAVNFRAYGLHCEVQNVPAIKAYSATGGLYAGRLKLVDPLDNGNDTFLDADLYTTEIDSYEGVAPTIAKIRGGVFFNAKMCDPNPTRWDIDSTTLQYSTFEHAGNTTLGALPESPYLGGAALTLGGPAKFWPRTTAQRNALIPAIGWTIFNTSTNALETWNGSSWV